MELSALLAKNNKSFIEHTRKGRAQEENQLFLNNLLALGMTVTSDTGYNIGGSSLKSEIDRLKNKFKLKNGIK